MRQYIILLLIIFPAEGLEYSSSPHASDLPEGGWIELGGSSNLLQVPTASMIRPDLNWSYPLKFYPIFAAGQNITASFWGSSSLAGQEAKLCVSPVGIRDLLSALEILDLGTNMSCNGTSLEINETGDAGFRLMNISSGLYNIYLLDDLNRTVLSASPLLITSGDAEMDLTSRVTAGDPLKVKLNTSGPPGNYTFGALMISRKNYDSASLTIYSNGTLEGLAARLSIGNRSLELQGLPKDYKELVMEVFNILPENSAAALQESSKPEAQMYLLTDPQWERERYLLTCAVYSRERGIVAVKQREVEVV
jgi:methanogen extracellular protein (TIGR04279 family)